MHSQTEAEGSVYRPILSQELWDNVIIIRKSTDWFWSEVLLFMSQGKQAVNLDLDAAGALQAAQLSRMTVGV